jgi:cation:H+ antiporter
MSDLLLPLGLVVAGLLMLLAGGEVLLRGAVSLSVLLRLTPAVIGLTVVAAGTSVPELAVSTLASWRGSTDIAVGNVVGSNILNIAVILGLAALVRPPAITGNTIRLEYPVMALVTLLAVAVCQDGTVSRLDAVLFLATYVLFTTYLVGLVRRQVSETEARGFREEVAAMAEPARHARGALMSLGLVLGGVVLLGSGADATVRGAVALARLIGWSERLIGLTVVAVGTSLPEVVTSVLSSARGRDDIAVANVIGSNLFNLLAILGTAALISPLAVHPVIIRSDLWWMLGVTLLLFPLVATGRRISRLEGLVLLAAYGVYLVSLLRRGA